MGKSKNLEKFKELLVYIVTNFNINRTLTETKLWKLLYFCEADFFEKSKKTITGVDYYKNKFGATPDKKIIDQAHLQLKGFIKRKKIKKKDGRTITVYESLKEYPYKYLSAQEVEEARKTCEKYYRLSVSAICVLAHKDPPYLGAKVREKVDFNFVVYREEETEPFPPKKEVYKDTISDEAGRRLLAYAKGNS